MSELSAYLGGDRANTFQVVLRSVESIIAGLLPADNRIDERSFANCPKFLVQRIKRRLRYLSPSVSFRRLSLLNSGTVR